MAVSGRADRRSSTHFCRWMPRQVGISHEVLSAPQIRERFAQFGPVRDDAVGYFEPEGGYIRPERCIAAQLKAASDFGATIITETEVSELQSEDDELRVRAGERTVVASKATVCAGMWSSNLLGSPFDRLLKVCRQTLFWFQIEEPTIFPQGSPSFILAHGASEADFCYGFPPIRGEGSMKIATEQYVGLQSPDALNRTVSPAEVAAMYRTHIRGQITGVTSHLVKSSVCTYTVTPDYGFIIDDHPTMKDVTVVSACSGHGFKHSAGIGEAIAQRFLHGKSEADLSAFSLARFL
jgi:glycine/D-amino acid oxidase-like deaminating enzyme